MMDIEQSKAGLYAFVMKLVLFVTFNVGPRILAGKCPALPA